MFFHGLIYTLIIFIIFELSIIKFPNEVLEICLVFIWLSPFIILNKVYSWYSLKVLFCIDEEEIQIITIEKKKKWLIGKQNKDKKVVFDNLESFGYKNVPNKFWEVFFNLNQKRHVRVSFYLLDKEVEMDNINAIKEEILKAVANYNAKVKTKKEIFIIKSFYSSNLAKLLIIILLISYAVVLILAIMQKSMSLVPGLIIGPLLLFQMISKRIGDNREYKDLKARLDNHTPVSF